MAIYSKRPAPMADNFLGGSPSRAGRYGEAYSLDLNATSKHLLSDEGSYFVLTNPTPGTAVAFPISASSSFTSVFFVLKNSAPVGGTRVYFDYLKVLPTIAPASGTSMHFAIQVDTAVRYSSGGTGPISGVNPNTADGNTSVGQVYYASGGTAITAAAASSAVRLVARGTARSVIPAVLDEIVISAGTSAEIGSSSSTTAGRSASNCAPFILDGGSSAVFNIWFPSNAATGLSAEFELGWWER